MPFPSAPLYSLPSMSHNFLDNHSAFSMVPKPEPIISPRHLYQLPPLHSTDTQHYHDLTHNAEDWWEFVNENSAQVGEPFVQRIEYDKAFMDKALTKAQNFYFNKFLPAITPYMIISPCGYSSLSQNSPTKEIPMHRQVLPKLEPSTKCNTDPNQNLVMHRTSVHHIPESKNLIQKRCQQGIVTRSLINQCARR